MRSIKEQRADIERLNRDYENPPWFKVVNPYESLLNWTERARANLREMQSRLSGYEYCSYYESCDCPLCEAEKLLEELPE